MDVIMNKIAPILNVQLDVINVMKSFNVRSVVMDIFYTKNNA